MNTFYQSPHLGGGLKTVTTMTLPLKCSSKHAKSSCEVSRACLSPEHHSLRMKFMPNSSLPGYIFWPGGLALS